MSKFLSRLFKWESWVAIFERPYQLYTFISAGGIAAMTTFFAWFWGTWGPSGIILATLAAILLTLMVIICWREWYSKLRGASVSHTAVIETKKTPATHDLNGTFSVDLHDNIDHGGVQFLTASGSGHVSSTGNVMGGAGPLLSLDDYRDTSFTMLSNIQLREKALAIAERLREHEQNYEPDYSFDWNKPNQSEDEQIRHRHEQQKRNDELRNRSIQVFQSALRGEALAILSEIASRTDAEKSLSPYGVALQHGMLAGVRPVSEAAMHVERMARRLPLDQ